MVGLAVGAAAVDYATSLAALIVQGAHLRARRRHRPGPRAPARCSAAWPSRGPPRLPWSGRIGWVGHHRSGHRSRPAIHRLRLLRRHRRHRAHRRPPADPHPQGRTQRIMTRHVVFGTGQIGRLVAEQLLTLGHDVVAVNRSGRGDIPGAELDRRRRHRPGVHHPGRRRRRRRLLLPQRHPLRPMGRRVPAAATRRAHRRRRPPVPDSSCSTTSTPTAPPAAGTSSKPCRRSQSRPRPQPGPR